MLNRLFIVLLLVLVPVSVICDDEEMTLIGEGLVANVKKSGKKDKDATKKPDPNKIIELKIAKGEKLFGGAGALRPYENSEYLKAEKKYNLIMVTKSDDAKVLIIFDDIKDVKPKATEVLKRFIGKVKLAGEKDIAVRTGDTVKLYRKKPEVIVQIFRTVEEKEQQIAEFTFIPK